MTETVTDQKNFTTTGSAEPNEGTDNVTSLPNAEETRASLLRQAYGAATTALREAHRDEFDRLYVAEATKRGVDYKPKPTAEQKAEQEFQRLLEQYPHLAEKVASED